ncbi:MAG: hypothetical protein R8G01_00995 [Ilumatobacteraceae bacterium]|nr:hypothetical protein [Ilumatobacteraceae bacterium]
MSASGPDRGEPDEFALTADERRQVERSIERESVWHLIWLGLAITFVAGIGLWFAKWDAATFDRFDSVDGRTIAVPYECNAPVRVHVDERADRVVVRLETRTPANNQDCANSVCVHLDAPLGDRPVIDERTGSTARRGFDDFCGEP